MTRLLFRQVWSNHTTCADYTRNQDCNSRGAYEGQATVGAARGQTPKCDAYKRPAYLPLFYSSRSKENAETNPFDSKWEGQEKSGATEREKESGHIQ